MDVSLRFLPLYILGMIEGGCCDCSEDEFLVRVDLFEGSRGALIKDTLSLKALVLHETIGCHARSEQLHLVIAEML